MHFPVDPVMTVVSGVWVGNVRNKCRLFMWVSKLQCMSPNQDIEQPANCQGPVGDRCATVKLEPTWTSNFLREQQEADANFKVIIGWKKASERKPLWEDVSPHSRAVKTLWSQWDRLLFMNGVL